MYTILHTTATELRFKKHHTLTMSSPYFKGEQVTPLLFQGGFVVDVNSDNARLRSNLQKIYEPADALKTLSYYTVDAVLTAAKMIYEKHHTYNREGFITEVQTILAKNPEVGDFSSLKKFFEGYEKPTEFISSIQEALALPAVPVFWYWRMFFAVKIYQENLTKSEDPRVESPYSEGQVLELDAELTQRIYVSASAVPHYCYGLSDDEVHSYADRLFNELVPGSGPAKTVAGELLRAWNDLMYRWYNDGDWVEKGGGFNGDESFSPRSVSNMKYLTSHGAGQIAYFFENCDSVHDFERKVERMLLNQIVKKDLDKQPNSIDSRSYWRPGRSY